MLGPPDRFNKRQGQTLAILGPNGAGKSTLLKALAGILSLSKGERNEGEGLKLGVFTQASGRAWSCRSYCWDSGMQLHPQAALAFVAGF